MNELLAYEASDEEGAVIVFAKTEEEAVETGASELNTDAEATTVNRVPDYDQYASQGYVPVKVLYEDYWWFYCWRCGSKVSLLNEDEPVFEEKRIFCNSTCQSSFHQGLAQRKEERGQAWQKLMDDFPGISMDACCGGGDYLVSIQFKFPGCKTRVSWSSDKPGVVRIPQVDLAAWDEFIKTSKGEKS
ncbi:MAG TPA: hypothetical protein V6D33_07125 [Cyanophyceae cyanobacterium]